MKKLLLLQVFLFTHICTLLKTQKSIKVSPFLFIFDEHSVKKVKKVCYNIIFINRQFIMKEEKLQ